ncbi:hypothetical protein QO259_05670 [Salinicola sp. JS01]|uniref:hypothetical protein n=1 Tax=Salinicola sp. JS01 TaxID=3050071 RepID=UPI00255B7425|nr:hypothetical protein [Salinicola sp. JS01]WIX34151.1 hypothetical protein QO259_05670 [Salinicola sp. JS01]
MQFIVVFFLVFFVVFGVKGCFSDEKNTEQARKLSRTYEVREIFRSAVRSGLKDPSSAQFRNEFFGQSGGNAIGCGEVNAKNSFGGKSGYKRFVTAGKSVSIEGESEDFSALWGVFCAPYK